MLPWMAHLVGRFGYAGVALLMAMENVVLPMPSELIMPLAGFVAAEGRLTLFGVITAGTVGSVLGSVPLYVLARAVGEDRLKAWIDAHGRWLMLDASDLERPRRWFDRHGALAVVMSQLVPGIRALIALPAGYARQNAGVFVLASLVGTTIWCAVLAWIGEQLGVHYRAIEKFLGPAGWIIFGGLAAWFVWSARRRRRRRERRPSRIS